MAGNRESPVVPLLQIQSLRRSFAETKALDGASLTIAAGEIVALMGANGAGKSTLVKILSGVLAADSGEIAFKGESFAPHNPSEAAKAAMRRPTDSVGDMSSGIIRARLTRDGDATGAQRFAATRFEPRVECSSMKGLS